MEKAKFIFTAVCMVFITLALVNPVSAQDVAAKPVKEDVEKVTYKDAEKINSTFIPPMTASTTILQARIAESMGAGNIKRDEAVSKNIVAMVDAQSPDNGTGFGFAGSSRPDDILAFDLGMKLFMFPIMKVVGSQDDVKKSLAVQKRIAKVLKFGAGLQEAINAVIASNSEDSEMGNRVRMASLFLTAMNVYSINGDRLTGYFLLGCWSGIITGSAIKEIKDKEMVAIGISLLEGFEKGSASTSSDKKMVANARILINEYNKPSPNLERMFETLSAMNEVLADNPSIKP